MRTLCFHPVVSSVFLLSSIFFLAQSQRLEIGCLPYFDTWCGLSANLECRSVSCLGSFTVRQSCGGRQPNFAALNRGHHLYSAGRPSRWASAHILVANLLPKV